MRRLGLLSLGIFVFTIPWENTLVFLDSISISRVAGGLAFLCALLYSTTRGRLRTLDSTVLLAGGFVLLMVFSCAWSTDTDATLDKVPTYLQLLAMLWVCWELAAEKHLQQILMTCYVGGCAVSMADTCWNFVSGTPVLGARYAADGFDPNNVALTIAISLPTAWWASRNTESRLLRLACFAYVPIAIFAIALTASRGGMLATVAALSVVPLTVKLRRAVTMLASLVLIAAVVATLALWVPSASWARLLTVQDEFAAGDLNHREALWRAGLEQVGEHPLLGVGAAAYKSATANSFGGGGVAHNTFLSVLVETGLVGAAIFAAVLIQVGRAICTMPGQRRALWATTLLTWAVGVSALSWTYQKTTWLLFIAIASEAHALSRESVSVINEADLRPVASFT